jgi:general secretion pathway protein J
MKQAGLMGSPIAFEASSQIDDAAGARGFTLLEVLVALVITALVLGMVYSSYSAVMHTRERVTTAADLDMTARLVLSHMSREIEAAFLVKKAADAPPESRYTVFKGSQEEISGHPADRLSFTCFAHTKRGVDANESDQAIIEYEAQELQGSQEEHEGEGPPIALIRREWRRIPPPGETQRIAEPRPIPLADDIQGFRLRFRNDEGEWTDHWDSTDVRTLDGLPTAVEITLTLRDERGRDHEYVTVVSPKIEPIDRGQAPAAQGETQTEETPASETGTSTGNTSPAPAGGNENPGMNTP